MRLKLIILFLLYVCQFHVHAEIFDTNTTYHDQFIKLDKKKRNILLISEITAYTLSLYTLNELWYADYPKSNFHFINDNSEWLQMDKFGHMSASYYSGVAGISAYKWTGMKRKNAIWYGGLTGSFFLTIIEYLDGKSAQWGASAGDLLANTTGSMLAISQELYWNEQRIQLKYSYSPSKWASANPAQLGENNVQRLLKDYNGQTYWVTFNIKSIFKERFDNFPEWFSLALGYSGDNMISPYQNPNDEQRKRQYIFSLDLDLNKIKTKNKLLNSVLHTFGFLKFPMPAIEWSNKSLHWHMIYY